MSNATIYNADGSKRSEWHSKTAAIYAARALKRSGLIGHYVVNESNAEIIWNAAS